MKYEEAEILIKKLDRIGVIKMEALIHALVDIRSSFHEIYDEIIPKIISSEDSADRVKDLFWDLREEFRHIEYHINDAKLIDL